MIGFQDFSSDEIEERLIEILEEDVLIDGKIEVKKGENPYFKETLDMDSIEMVDFATAIEAEYDIEIDDGIISDWERLGDAVKSVIRGLGGDPPED